MNWQCYWAVCVVICVFCLILCRIAVGWCGKWKLGVVNVCVWYFFILGWCFSNSGWKICWSRIVLINWCSWLVIKWLCGKCWFFIWVAVFVRGGIFCVCFIIVCCVICYLAVYCVVLKFILFGKFLVC